MTHESAPGPRWRLTLIAIAIAIVFVGLAGHGLATMSATADERGAHVPAGLLRWKSGVFSGGLANPPLGQLLIGAGALFAPVADQPLAGDAGDVWPARLPGLLLGLATVLSLHRTLRRPCGETAALAAAGAAALSPNWVAHSGLATLDLPVAAFSWMAAATAWSFRRDAHPLALLGFALAFGAAVATKFTALHLLPPLLLGSLLLGGPRGRRTGALFAAAAAGTWTVVWLTYGPGDAEFGWPAQFVTALRDKWSHGAAGHAAYLLGRHSPTGFPHYFLVALLVKVPISLQALVLAGGFFLVRAARSRGAGRPRDLAGLAAFGLLPALALLLAFTFVHRVDIGLRHVLPAFPAGFALAGVGFAGLWSAGRGFRALAVGLGAGLVLSAATTTPHALSYFHRVAGGPLEADRILIDSNLDWGQDEARLQKWLAAAPSSPLAVNPARPVAEGLVVVQANARRGALARDDLRLRWVSHLPVVERIGTTWTVSRVDEAALRAAATASPLGALDYAWWLVGTGRPDEAGELLPRADLSAHPRFGAQWHRVTAEAALAAGDLPAAIGAARRAEDPDLARVIAWETGGRRRDSVPDAGAAAQLLGALRRRGDQDAARTWERTYFGEAWPPAGPPTYERAAQLRLAGREGEALAVAGAALAQTPAHEDLIWLYGELVVRRTLGVTQFPWPNVDWREIDRADALWPGGSDR